MFTRSRRLKGLLGSFVLVGAAAGGALVAPSAAQAVGVPACVKVRVLQGDFGNDYVHLHNTCRTSQRMYVIWKYDRDSECFTLARGEKQYRSPHTSFGKYDRLAGC